MTSAPLIKEKAALPDRLFNRNYLTQWQGQTVSRLGSQLLTAALVFWVKEATGSATIMGLAAFISGVPAVLLMPIGGAVADRFSRRKIIIVSDLIRSVLLMILAFLLLFTPDAKYAILAMLLVSSTLANIIGSFFGPAISATIPDLVPANRLTAANSMGQLSVQSTQFIGQALGGVLYRLLGPGLLVLINSFTFLYSSVSELFVKIPQTIPERAPDWRQQLRIFRADIREGLRYIVRVPGLREIVGLSAVLSFFTAPILVLMAFYVEDTLGARSDWYGFILSAQGVGAILGYLLAGVLNLGPVRRSHVIMAMTFVAACADGALGVVRLPVQALAVSVIAGIASGFVTVHVTTLVQTIVPSEMRGRLLGVLAAISGALVPIAMGLAGIVADLVNQNIRLIYVSCGLIMLLSAILLATRKAYRGILATPFTSDIERGGMPRDGTAGKNRGDERTRDVYEDIPGYTKPPRPPVPAVNDLDEVLTDLNQPRGSVGRAITDAIFTITGFRKFLERLPSNIDTYQKTCNGRLPGLYAPVIAATVALKDDPGVTDGLTRAAALVLGAIDLQRDVFSGRLPPDMLHGEPLEMGQYPNFFATSQIIEDGKVQIFKSARFDRINVIASGRFHILHLADGANLAGVRATLEQIVQEARSGADGDNTSPGLLTCATLPVQVRAFGRMAQDLGNAAALEALKHTAFTLCLDEDLPDSIEAAARLAHSQNPHNRWYHASLQLVVFGNGRACAVCNFSAYLDGNVMMRGSAEIQRRAAAAAADAVRDGSVLPVTRLTWRTPAPALVRAAADRARILDTQRATFDLPGFGRSTFRKHGLDGVSAFVLALQAATNSFAGRHTRIVQFLTMSRYRYTDLNEARMSKADVQAFADYLTQGKVDPQVGRLLMDRALRAAGDAMRRGRKWLPLPDIIGTFVTSASGPTRIWRDFWLRLRLFLLNRLGVFRPLEREVLISFPISEEDAPIVGRPGVRLPYTRCFGLHYQIFENRTVITVMPGAEWRVPNSELRDRLYENLAAIIRLAETETPAAAAERAE